MSIFPGFGGWINQSTQQPLKGESKKSGSLNSKSNLEINTHKMRDETKKQLQLWRDAEKKEPWHDAPPKVKVNIQRDNDFWGLCQVKTEFTLGLPPEEAYYLITNPDNKPSSRIINGRELLKNISRKVTSEDKGYGQGVEAEKALSWNFLWLSRTIPLHLTFSENPRDLSVQYEKNTNTNTMTYMETFMGLFRMEPIFVDSKLLCKHIDPRSREEYEKCSGGQGRIATKVKMTHYFQPSSFYNLPPVSWYFRWFTVKTIKTLIEDLQTQASMIRRA